MSINFEIEIFELEDGDFLDAYWYRVDNLDAPIVILLHGLTGSFKSPYIQGAMSALHKEGFHSVLMHFRSCSNTDNRLKRSYHAGDTEDILAFSKHIQKHNLKNKLFCVGYSLGGNVLLKLQGEQGENSPFCATMSVSAPMDLGLSAKSINRGFSRYYQHRLMKELNTSLKRKYAKHSMKETTGLKLKEIDQLKTFVEFDDAYTAPVHGFSSAKEYYRLSSSKQYLKKIQKPTLIIHALDDPFMSPDILPKKDEISSFVELEVSKNGGHVGFVGGSFTEPVYWLDKKVCSYFKKFT